ncbi:MAG: DNA polymerase I, partial [Candidatus Omnitrophica bacterium]|nr:DNA polymerase I [Candidatus Omnitrophota bacterium]
MHKRELYLIDATAFCYRAFFALPKLSTSFGQPTGAIFGFVNMLHKILKEKNPQYLGVCFDISRKTFRQEKFSAYKIHRPQMPEELISQIPFIKKIISAWGIRILEKEGYEADDLIATLVKRAKEKGFSIIIVSSDKDILQLVDETVSVLNPYQEDMIYDVEKVKEKFGVLPSQIVDLIALMGDTVDNIPGIAGIGEKTALELIKEFRSLDNILNEPQRIKKTKIREAILNNIAQIRLNQQLASLDTNLDLGLEVEDLRVSSPNQQEMFNLFRYLEFKKLIKEMNLTWEDISGSELNFKEIEDKEEFPFDVKELYISFISGEIAVLVDNKIFVFNQMTSKLNNLLSSPHIKKIGYDLKRVKVNLKKRGGNLEGIYFDTMIAGYLLNPSKSYQEFEELCWDYLDTALTSNLTAGQQIRLIYKLKPILEERLKERELLRLFYELEMPLVEVLAQIELNGIKLDIPVLEGLSLEVENRLNSLIKKIYDLAGVDFNLNSPRQIQEILFGRLKLPVVKKTKTGASTDEEVLKVLEEKHPLVKHLLEYRQLNKLKNTYIDPLKNMIEFPTKKVYTSFNQTATETGRLSSSNPNFQNIPIKTELGKKIRSAVIASEKDRWLLSCDYSQIELRILAHLSKDKGLISAFKEDKDIHILTASLIYGVKEKEVQDSMR